MCPVPGQVFSSQLQLVEKIPWKRGAATEIEASLLRGATDNGRWKALEQKMKTDPYQILGVKRDATQKDIQSAFRKLAKKHHPDLNPGDKKAEELFKEISAAHEIIGDEEKRKLFDLGQIDINGSETASRQRRQYATADEFERGAGGFSDMGGFEDILSSFMSNRGGRGEFRSKGGDLQISMDIDFLDALNGKSVPVKLPEGGTLEVGIPAGTRDGQTLRLRGKGAAGFRGGPSGDALIEIRVRPHPFFSRDGDDIRMDLPVSLREAILGGKVRAPTPSGDVQLNLKPYSNGGTVLRLKGKGARRQDGQHGDLFVRIVITLPETPDPALTEFFESRDAATDYNPRKNMTV
jgi:DnaJ-class molecular chaperone